MEFEHINAALAVGRTARAIRREKLAENCQVTEFLAGWQKDDLGLKPAFEEFQDFLQAVPGVSLDFKARPGISYSLRAKGPGQKKRELFTLVDVVDDEPDARWLSVCFYADMVTDPDEFGDFVPQGLLGEDAICFNLDKDDAALQGYILDRLKEAAKNAGA